MRVFHMKRLHGSPPREAAHYHSAKVPHWNMPTVSEHVIGGEVCVRVCVRGVVAQAAGSTLVQNPKEKSAAVHTPNAR